MFENRLRIVGLGEALFDVFRGAARLGGAPLNVAVHAHQLGQAAGENGGLGEGLIVSRVGQDALGERVAAQLTERGMSAAYLQSDPDRPTGRVFVTLDDAGQPSYEIAGQAAWDNLWYDPDLEELARTCDAVCFGTLAQRDAQSRNTIYRFLSDARHAIRLFDVNLRQDFFDQRMLRRSCELATVVKLNEEELPRVAEMLGIDAPPDPDTLAEALRQQCELKHLILTRGARGTRAYHAAGHTDGAPASYDLAPKADSVGAGDACSAGLLIGWLLRLSLQETLDLANHCGAFVASQPGATPVLPDAILDRVRA